MPFHDCHQYAILVTCLGVAHVDTHCHFEFCHRLVERLFRNKILCQPKSQPGLVSVQIDALLQRRYGVVLPAQCPEDVSMVIQPADVAWCEGARSLITGVSRLVMSVGVQDHRETAICCRLSRRLFHRCVCVKQLIANHRFQTASIDARDFWQAGIFTNSITAGEQRNADQCHARDDRDPGTTGCLEFHLAIIARPSGRFKRLVGTALAANK